MVEVADAIKNAVALETLSLLEPKLLSQLQEIDTPLPANDLAYEEAKRTIEKSLASRELGVFSDEEIALALVSGLDSSPLALAQTLHLLDLIPADIRELMKSG
jgi:asparagine synthetase B (glutamine-hydrolysing)